MHDKTKTIIYIGGTECPIAERWSRAQETYPEEFAYDFDQLAFTENEDFESFMEIQLNEFGKELSKENLDKVVDAITKKIKQDYNKNISYRDGIVILLNYGIWNKSLRAVLMMTGVPGRVHVTEIELIDIFNPICNSHHIEIRFPKPNLVKTQKEEAYEHPECPLCGIIFSSKKAILRHMEAIHDMIHWWNPTKMNKLIVRIFYKMTNGLQYVEEANRQIILSCSVMFHSTLLSQ